jgi:hypothetical protein
MEIRPGQRAQYRPVGITGTITEVANERHRARIMLDDGRDIQEVPFHELLEAPAAPAAPAPAPAPDEAAVVLDETADDTERQPKVGRKLFGHRADG